MIFSIVLINCESPLVQQYQLSQVELSNAFIDAHIDSLRIELGDNFEAMVAFLKKIKTTL